MDEEFSRDPAKEAAADRLANAAFVLGIISLFSTLCGCPFVFSAVGIVLALISKGAEKTLRPKAKTGLALSVIGMVVSLVLTVFTIALPFVLMKANPEYKKVFVESFEESLEDNEEMFRSLYGDEVYEEMVDMVDEFMK